VLIQSPKDFKLVLNAANWTFGEYFEKAGGKGREDFQQNIECRVKGVGSLKYLTPDEQQLIFLQELLGYLTEIEESFATLADCARLFRASPKLPKGVSVHRFRKLLLESHLEELYVFINRIDRCITFFQRAYARDVELERVGVLGSKLKTIIKKKFANIISIRGIHTHRVRLSHILEDHRRILFLETLSTTSDDPTVERILSQARRQFQQEARQKLNEFTLGAKDALLGLTQFLIHYTDRNGLFRIPRRYAK
jgi:hypothetical protein